MHWLVIVAVLACQVAIAQPYEELYSNDGEYLGNTNTNSFDPNSINNPYGDYGSPYSAKSIKNPYGDYGSQYSTRSPNNP